VKELIGQIVAAAYLKLKSPNVDEMSHDETQTFVMQWMHVGFNE
jgi:hypothetical protein